MFRETEDLNVSTPVTGGVFSSGALAAPPPRLGDDLPAGSVGAGAITVGTSVSVNIETKGDHDWYAVTLEAGKTYTIHTTFDASNTDAYLSLRNASGGEVAANDDGGERNNALISYTPTVSGTFYIDAGTWDNLTTGSFYLSVAQDPPPGPDAMGETAATAGTLAVNGSVNGVLETGTDHDWYAISLQAGQTYLFRTGATTPDAEIDTQLTLRDAGGNQMLTNDDVGEGVFSGIRFTPTSSGTYYLDVSGTIGGASPFNLTAFKAPTPTVFTNDQIALQLTEGYWQRYDHHFDVTAGGTLTYNVTGLTAAGQALAREAVAIWGDVTGIRFAEVTTGGQIVYDDEEDGAFASSEYVGTTTTSAKVNIDKTWLTKYGDQVGDYPFQAYLHETGHALGLGHAGNYNNDADFAFDSIYLNDSWATTVMSYFSQGESTYFDGLGFSEQFIVTPMAADGVAVANLYGVATTTRTGNTVYGFNSTADRAFYNAGTFTGVSYTIFDNGGVDTLDFSGFGQNQVITLVPEAFSNVGGLIGNVVIARGSVIENAIAGPGNDLIIGNDVANVLRGGAGDDLLAGHSGADTLDGGSGVDTISYAGDAGAIFINLTLGQGYGNAAQGDVFVSIENVIGTDYNDFIIGDPGVNRLDGALGNDIIIGAVGPDVIIGGGGLDWASYEDNSGVVFINLTLARGYNNAAEGDSYSGIENLVGGLMDDFFIGDEGANRLNGAMGADTLLGAGGADIFMFTYAPGATSVWGGPNVDLILDFHSGEDIIELSSAAFPGLAAGGIPTGAFALGTVAADADDRIVYDQASGHLWFDPDGAGGQAALLFATLGETSHPAIAATDFAVV